MCVRVCVVDERGETLLNTFVAVGAGDGLPRRAHRHRRGKRAAPLRGRAEPAGGARDGSRDTEPGFSRSDSRVRLCQMTTLTQTAPLWLWGTTWRTTWLASGSRRACRRAACGTGALRRAVQPPHAQAVQTARLAKELLNVDIQSPNQAHDPREDALAAMRLRGGKRCARIFYIATQRRSRSGARRFVRRRRRARRNEAAAFRKKNRTRRFECWCLDGCLDRTPPPLAPLAPSHARSTAAAVAGVL